MKNLKPTNRRCICPTCYERFNTEMADWMEEAEAVAETCKDQHAVALCISAWMQTAAQNQRNTDYYRSLVERCGRAIGEEAYTQDDGGKVPDVLCAKVPALVEKLGKGLLEWQQKK